MLIVLEHSMLTRDGVVILPVEYEYLSTFQPFYITQPPGTVNADIHMRSLSRDCR